MQEFSFATVENFAQHIEKSIPGYSLLIQYVIEITRSFAVKDTDTITGVDLGASTGDLLLALSQEYPGADFLGYDIEQNMIENAVFSNMEFADITVDDFPYSQVFYSIFTLQFLRNSGERKEVIEKVYKKLPDRGAFIVAEKVLGDSVFSHDILRNAQMQYKRQHFTEEAILSKENDLRRIMRPEKESRLVDELVDAGFCNIQKFWQSGLFVGYLCIKEVP